MARYRKLPVVIEARRIPVYRAQDVLAYVDEACALAEWTGGISHLMNEEGEHGGPHILIPTLEGEMRGEPGDWIIRGVKGEYYPCKPDVFDATYELVS